MQEKTTAGVIMHATCKIITRGVDRFSGARVIGYFISVPRNSIEKEVFSFIWVVSGVVSSTWPTRFVESPPTYLVCHMSGYDMLISIP